MRPYICLTIQLKRFRGRSSLREPILVEVRAVAGEKLDLVIDYLGWLAEASGIRAPVDCDLLM